MKWIKRLAAEGSPRRVRALASAEVMTMTVGQSDREAGLSRVDGQSAGQPGASSMKAIAVINQKEGGSKTTLSMNLAAALVRGCSDSQAWPKGSWSWGPIL